MYPASLTRCFAKLVRPSLLVGAALAAQVVLAPPAAAIVGYHGPYGSPLYSGQFARGNDAWRGRPAFRTYGYAPYTHTYGYTGAPGSLGNNHVAWCSARFRSYSAFSDSYLGYDGHRHRCVWPY